MEDEVDHRAVVLQEIRVTEIAVVVGQDFNVSRTQVRSVKIVGCHVIRTCRIVQLEDKSVITVGL